MPLARTSAKPASGEDAGPYKPHYNLRKAKASNDTADTTDKNHASTSRAAATNSGPSRAKVPRERCTKEQMAALEEFYNLHGGGSTTEQMEELAARINKSYNSTAVWFRNRRAKGKATAERQTVIHATVDPITDATPLDDTIMLESTTPEHPEQPTQAMAAPLPHPQEAKKPRGRAARLKNAQIAISGPMRARRARATASSLMPTRPSSLGINNTPTDSLLIPDNRQPSGDSVSQPPKSNSPTVVQSIAVVPRVPTNPKHALEKYPRKEQVAAQTMTKMAAMTKNPAIVAGEILSDSPRLYEPWAFPLPSALNRRTSRSRSQKGDIGQWRHIGEEHIYRVVPHMVPQSWMAGPPRTGKVRHP